MPIQQKIILTILLCVFLCNTSFAQISFPMKVSYQGYLTNTAGTPLDNIKVKLTFRIYDDTEKSVEEAVWSDIFQEVPVKNGIFSVLLGAGDTPLPSVLFMEGKQLWLGIQVNENAEMKPRQEIVSSVFAIEALHAQSAETALFAEEAQVCQELGGYKPEDFASVGHNHDEIYYQQSYIDKALAGKSDVGHNHDDVYSLKEHNHDLIYAKTVHNHNDIYYTKDEITALLLLKSNIGHTHDETGVTFPWAKADKAGGNALKSFDSDKLNGFLPNVTGLPVANTIPLTGSDGKIPEALLPFKKGDLLAPTDRQLVSGLKEYETGYFSIEELGIEGNIATNVKEGVKFGPGKDILGTLKLINVFWIDGVYQIYDDFSSGTIDPEKWTITTSGSGSNTVIISSTENAGGLSPEMRVQSFSPQWGSSQSAKVVTKNLSKRKSYHCKIYITREKTGEADIGYSIVFIFDLIEYSLLTGSSRGPNIAGLDHGNQAMFTTDVTIIYKDLDKYDVYIGGKKVGSDINTTSPSFGFKTTTGGVGGNNEIRVSIYIDDIVFF